MDRQKEWQRLYAKALQLCGQVNKSIKALGINLRNLYILPNTLDYLTKKGTSGLYKISFEMDGGVTFDNLVDLNPLFKTKLIDINPKGNDSGENGNDYWLENHWVEIEIREARIEQNESV